MTATIRVSGTDIAFPCDGDERILDAAERAGYVMPYSCRKGVCDTCKVDLVEGSARVFPLGAAKNAGEKILSCITTAGGDVEIRPAWIKPRQQPLSQRMKAVVHRIVDRTSQVAIITLRLPIGRRVIFSAGQYLRVILDNGESRNYSFANPPHINDAMEIHVRRIPGGLFSDRILRSLSNGSVVELECPFGLFTWAENSVAPIIMLATGTGFAPLKSMIEDRIRRKIQTPVHLFWGGFGEDDLYDGALAEKWAHTHPWFQFTPVLASPGAQWSGCRGFVQDAVVAEYGYPAGYDIYACGNPNMIEAARDRFQERPGLLSANFFSDAFVSSAGPPGVIPALQAPLQASG